MRILDASRVLAGREALEKSHPAVAEWLRNYRGNFKYYKQLQVRYENGYELSTKQVASIEKAIARDAQNAKSEHLGSPGQYLQGEVTVEGIRDIETRYGPSTIFTFRDDKGNVLKWFTSSNPQIEKGQKGELTGKVKKHDEWQGTKQTVLTRCKFLPSLSPEEAAESASHFSAALEAA